MPPVLPVLRPSYARLIRPSRRPHTGVRLSTHAYPRVPTHDLCMQVRRDCDQQLHHRGQELLRAKEAASEAASQLAEVKAQLQAMNEPLALAERREIICMSLREMQVCGGCSGRCRHRVRIRFAGTRPPLPLTLADACVPLDARESQKQMEALSASLAAERSDEIRSLTELVALRDRQLLRTSSASTPRLPPAHPSPQQQQQQQGGVSPRQGGQLPASLPAKSPGRRPARLPTSRPSSALPRSLDVKPLRPPRPASGAGDRAFHPLGNSPSAPALFVAPTTPKPSLTSSTSFADKATALWRGHEADDVRRVYAAVTPPQKPWVEWARRKAAKEAAAAAAAPGLTTTRDVGGRPGTPTLV